MHTCYSPPDISTANHMHADTKFSYIPKEQTPGSQDKLMQTKQLHDL